jgi:hypothetical protein
MATQVLLPTPQPAAFDRELIVPQAFVHKHSAANAFVTHLRKLEEDRFLCRARIPGQHPFFSAPGSQPSGALLFCTEAGRQAGIAVSHAFYDVPANHAFILGRARTCLLESDWLASGLTASSSITMEVKVRDKEVRRAGYLAKMVADYSYFSRGEAIAVASGEWTLQPDAVYRRLRQRSPRTGMGTRAESIASVMHPGGSARTGVQNVVIAEPCTLSQGQGVACMLRVDQGHPFFFDHPCDHIPGMLLCEAASQAALLAAARLKARSASEGIVQASELCFLNFAELHEPVRVEARIVASKRSGRGSLDNTAYVQFAQGEVELAEATMQVVFPWKPSGEEHPSAWGTLLRGSANCNPVFVA